MAILWRVLPDRHARHLYQHIDRALERWARRKCWALHRRKWASAGVAGQDARSCRTCSSITGASPDHRLDDGSRMTRECHVRFCERLRGKFLRPTHHFGMKAHIGVDADSGLVHTVATTPANEADVEVVDELLHGKEQDVRGPATSARTRVRRKKLNGRSRRSAARSRRWPMVVRSASWRRSRKAQGERARQGRASVPRDQAPVRLRQGALSRPGVERRAGADAVRVVQSVDVEAAVVGDDGVVASAAPESAKSASETRVLDPKIRNPS